MSSEISELLEKPNRRTILAGLGGILAGKTVAGCVTNEPSDEDNNYPITDTNDYSQDNDENSSLEYNLRTSIPEEVDFEQIEYLPLEIYVERTLNGETEILKPENLEINGKTKRNHPKYGDDRLKEAGLFNEIQQLEPLSEHHWKITKDRLIAGDNQLKLTIQYEDPDYDTESKSIIEEELTVNKNDDEILEDTWLNDHKLWEELRQNHIEQQLNREIIYGSNRVIWGEIAEDIKETVPEKYEIEDMVREEKIHRYAFEWISRARDAVSGAPSGQANYLAHTLEHIFDHVTAGAMPNAGHHTVIAHFHDENKTYHVETARGGITTHPPAENGWTAGNPEKTPLWETETALGAGQSTLIGMVRLGDWYNDTDIVSDEFVIDTMTAIREDTDAVPGLIDFMQELALTTEFSPEIDYEITGTAEKPVFTPNF